MSELRIALRSLSRTPRLFMCAVVCLTGALGTATAVFAIVNGVVLCPLPFAHAPRLVTIWSVSPGRDTVKRGFSWPDPVRPSLWAAAGRRARPAGRGVCQRGRTAARTQCRAGARRRRSPGAGSVLARDMMTGRVYRLVDRHNREVPSATPGTLGGHRRTKIFGRLDCPAAARAIARGGYRRHRVFFADAATARAAGFRPCAVCLAGDYRIWKAQRRGAETDDVRSGRATRPGRRRDRPMPPS